MKYPTAEEYIKYHSTYPIDILVEDLKLFYNINEDVAKVLINKCK